jgi:hypothetical protein
MGVYGLENGAGTVQVHSVYELQPFNITYVIHNHPEDHLKI